VPLAQSRAVGYDTPALEPAGHTPDRQGLERRTLL